MKTTSPQSKPLMESSSDAAVRGGQTDLGAIELPWGGSESLELRLPSTGAFAGASVEVVWPELGGPVVDYPAELEAALESPVDSSRLDEQVECGRAGGDRSGRSVTMDAGA